MNNLRDFLVMAVSALSQKERKNLDALLLKAGLNLDETTGEITPSILGNVLSQCFFYHDVAQMI